ncbi:MAG: amidohydrolase family protein [Candidatus Aminicenantales bacterium]
MIRKIIRPLLLIVLPLAVLAQSVVFSPETRKYILYQTPVMALKNANVIDGTGSPARSNQTVIIREGRIAEIGASEEIRIPEGAQLLDLAGKSLLPGWIMLHEHLFYPAGGGQFNPQSTSFPRLYLAGGVTTIRTTGSIEPYTDLNIKKAIEAGRIPGPKMDVSSPYLNGPGLTLLQMKALQGPEDARRMVAYWDSEGVDSFKVYQQISQAELKAVIEEAHKRGKKVTGHLGAVTYREAADLGIDNLEHGFFASTDFVSNKIKDKSPSSRALRDSLQKLDPDGSEVKSLIQHLIEKGVALTSTLPVFETMTPGRPPAPNAALDALLPETRDLYLRNWARIANNPGSEWSDLFKKGMKLEKMFFDAGGLLIVGTDPTGYGGVIAGYSNSRAIELLVEAGLSPLEAIQVATRNGARYLEIDHQVGTIEVGKIADLVVVNGNPASNIQDIRNIAIVFKDGIGYDPEKLLASVKGAVGLR